MSDPKFDFTVKGERTIRDFFLSKTISPVGVLERDINNITASSGDIDIPIDNIGSLSYLYANSTDAKITITAGGVDSVLNFSGLVVYDLESTFASTITAITVSTTSTSAIDCFIGIYGV